jgi:hypothetical protein
MSFEDMALRPSKRTDQENRPSLAVICQNMSGTTKLSKVSIAWISVYCLYLECNCVGMRKFLDSKSISIVRRA